MSKETGRPARSRARCAWGRCRSAAPSTRRRRSRSRIERARAVAREHGRAGYSRVQRRCSYLRPRADVGLPEGGHVHASPELLDYPREGPGLTLMAYSSLLSGAYTRPERRLPAAYDHPGTGPRPAALREVAAELGLTPNQVVLAWLMGGDPPVIPIVGVSPVDQLDEVLGTVDAELPADLRARLDRAGAPSHL